MVHPEEPGDVAHHRSEGKEVELGGTKAEDASPVHAGPVGTEPSEVERTSCRSNVLLLVPLDAGRGEGALACKRIVECSVQTLMKASWQGSSDWN